MNAWALPVIVVSVVLLSACATAGTDVGAASTTAAAAPPAVESYGIAGADRFFKLDWKASEHRGQTVVWGRIVNDWGYAARDIRLRVESLDAAGNVVATTIGYVPLMLSPGASAPFEVAVPAVAPAHRVSVLSYDWTLERKRRWP